MIRLLRLTFLSIFFILNLITHQNAFCQNELLKITINSKGKITSENGHAKASMKISDVNENILNDVNIHINIRGSSSRRYPKKSYDIRVDDNSNNISIADFPPGNDFILYASYTDKSLIRDVLVYELARKMGHYASRTQFTELYLNGNYEGVYVLEEKIKIDSSRVNPGAVVLRIDRPKRDEKYWNRILVTEIPGSYFKYKQTLSTILKNKNTNTQVTPFYISSAFPPVNSRWQKIEFRFYDPDGDKLTAQQVDSIRNILLSFESALAGNAFADSVSGYRKYLDYKSFLDFFILNEMTRNVDAYRLSTYFHFINGKIIMGPVWDFNIAMGNATSCRADDTTGWAYQFNEVCGNQPYLVPFWWERLMQDSLFRKSLNERWLELRRTDLNSCILNQDIDSLHAVLEDASLRNYNRWYTYPVNSKSNTKCENYNCEIDFLKTWLRNRMEWMDKNLK